MAGSSNDENISSWKNIKLKNIKLKMRREEKSGHMYSNPTQKREEWGEYSLAGQSFVS